MGEPADKRKRERFKKKHPEGRKAYAKAKRDKTCRNKR